MLSNFERVVRGGALQKGLPPYQVDDDRQQPRLHQRPSNGGFGGKTTLAGPGTLKNRKRLSKRTPNPQAVV